MSTVLTRPITIEEFEALPYAETERMELVRGVLVPKDPIDDKGYPMSPGAQHGGIQGRVYAFLLSWAVATKAGYVGVEAAYALDPDGLTVRIPDVSFLSNGRRTQGNAPKGAWQIAPDLAVEVISPSDRADNVRMKVTDYLSFGVPLVLTVWPESHEVVAHTADGISRTYGRSDVLEFSEILPGFSCTVEAIFDVEESF